MNSTEFIEPVGSIHSKLPLSIKSVISDLGSTICPFLSQPVKCEVQDDKAHGVISEISDALTDQMKDRVDSNPEMI